MKYLILFLLVLFFLTANFVNKNKAAFEFSKNNFLHEECLKRAPQKSNYQEWYQALVCGKSLTNSNEKYLLVSTSLIHIFVVSGSHFSFLEKFLNLLNKFPLAFLIKYFFLILYCFVTKLQPPVIKGFSQLILKNSDQALRLNHLFLTRQILGILICLVIFPSWISSFSFYLSCLVSLSLSVNFSSQFYQQTFLYLCLIYPLSFIGLPLPCAILLNLFVAPLIGEILFPLSALCFLIPPLSKIVDILFLVLEKFLQALHIQYTPSVQALNWVGLWTYLGGLVILIYFFQIRQNRKHIEMEIS